MCFLFHRALAAFLEMILRFFGDKAAALARPPFAAPSFDSATAAGFFSGAGFNGDNGVPSQCSPIRSSTTDRANRFGSRGRDLLARVGIANSSMACRVNTPRWGGQAPFPFSDACSGRHGAIITYFNAPESSDRPADSQTEPVPASCMTGIALKVHRSQTAFYFGP